MGKKADVQAMLYTFAHKFLKGRALENAKEVIKMTELGKMLHDEGVQEGIEKGKEDMVKEALLTKEQGNIILIQDDAGVRIYNHILVNYLLILIKRKYNKIKILYLMAAR